MTTLLLILSALYRLAVIGGAFALSWGLKSAWPLLAAVPLLILSPKGQAE
jgi:hypothetical protein